MPSGRTAGPEYAHWPDPCGPSGELRLCGDGRAAQHAAQVGTAPVGVLLLGLVVDVAHRRLDVPMTGELLHLRDVPGVHGPGAVRVPEVVNPDRGLLVPVLVDLRAPAPEPGADQ